MNHNFRFYVKTCYILGLSVQDIHNELVAAHGDASQNERTDFCWVAYIRSWCFELGKEKSPGRPVLTCTAAIVQNIQTLITLTVRCVRILHQSYQYPKHVF